MRTTLFVFALLAASSQVAFARDHQELVCSGIAKAQGSGDSLPVFIHYLDSRASDGKSRDQVLSTVYQRSLYQGVYLNKAGGLPTQAPIALVANKLTRFRGTFSIAALGETYKLKLTGKLTDDPADPRAKPSEVSVELPCVDLSI
jgi:hypothetical protein